MRTVSSNAQGIDGSRARWGAVFPGMFLLVLKTLGKCSRFRAKSGKVSGHLPARLGVSIVITPK